MIAALFVECGGAYWDLPGVDAWDLERDARKYAGPWPVVAHPPCERWSTLAYVVQARYGIRVGEDAGCFTSALASVRRWGGVLEHPRGSTAWRSFKIRRPGRSGWRPADAFGGWVCEVEQGHYGHSCPKLTWLYAVNTARPDLRWGPSPAAGRVELMASSGVRSVTPPAFRDLLISIARSVNAAPTSTQGNP